MLGSLVARSCLAAKDGDTGNSGGTLSWGQLLQSDVSDEKDDVKA